MLLCFSMTVFLEQPHCKSEFILWNTTKYAKLKVHFLWPCVCNPVILVTEVGHKSLCPKPNLFIVLTWCFRSYTLTSQTDRNFGLWHVSLTHSDTLSQRPFFVALYFVASFDGKVIVWYLLNVQAWSSTSYLPLGLYNERFCRYPIKL